MQFYQFIPSLAYHSRLYFIILLVIITYRCDFQECSMPHCVSYITSIMGKYCVSCILSCIAHDRDASFPRARSTMVQDVTKREVYQCATCTMHHAKRKIATTHLLSQQRRSHEPLTTNKCKHVISNCCINQALPP